jgi:hypothetical protein
MHSFDTTMQLATMRQDELLRSAGRRRSRRSAGRFGRRADRTA